MKSIFLGVNFEIAVAALLIATWPAFETVTARFQQLDSVSFRGNQETTQQHTHVDVCSLMRLSQRMKTFFKTYFIAMFFVDGFSFAGKYLDEANILMMAAQLQYHGFITGLPVAQGES